MTTAKAHANIALIKYWGKKDEALATPFTTSLSLTLDALYTITTVSIDPSLEHDLFILNGKTRPDSDSMKISRFVDLFRRDNQFVRIDSRNYFPTAAGLASSASGFAALATALNHEFEHDLNPKDLSRLTRRGSGSASRSLYGGFAVWEKGDDRASIAYPLDVDLDIEMIIVVISAAEKGRSSRDLMRQTVNESIFYPAWVEQSAIDLLEMKAALDQEDLDAIGHIAERNALSMHGTLLGLSEPYTYFQPDTLRVLDLVRNCRKDGIRAYATLDAGPNVKIITDSANRPAILERLRAFMSSDQLILAKPGPAAQLISTAEAEAYNQGDLSL